MGTVLVSSHWNLAGPSTSTSDSVPLTTTARMLKNLSPGSRSWILKVLVLLLHTLQAPLDPSSRDSTYTLSLDVNPSTSTVASHGCDKSRLDGTLSVTLQVLAFSAFRTVTKQQKDKQNNKTADRVRISVANRSGLQSYQGASDKARTSDL